MSQTRQIFACFIYFHMTHGWIEKRLKTFSSAPYDCIHYRVAELKRVILVFALFAVFSTFSFAAHAAGAPAMIVPGQSNVSSAGAFTYTIPITVPPGTAGMAPVLSLDYSSQSGDGMVGLGWMLSGLSSIERCPRTLAQDGVHGGVDYNSNDRFCFDGQRLVATSGTYGVDGTEYRTEIDAFSKIVSYGTAGTGPQYFKVWTKSGQIMEFGNSTDSRPLTGTTARSWAVNKVSDIKGNYFTVTYTNDTTNGQIYPARVDYTGNAGASLATYNSVQFSYSTSRADVVPVYHAGAMTKATVLLTNIKTYQGANLVSDYRLAYDAGTATRHSRLTSVTLCDASSNCLAPTTFGWQGTRDALTITPSSVAFVGGSLLGDFDGDGITDAYAYAPSGVTDNCTYSLHTATFTFYAGTTSGSYTTSNKTATFSGPGCNGVVVSPVVLTGAADWNGDGISGALLTATYTPFPGLPANSGYLIWRETNDGTGKLDSNYSSAGGNGTFAFVGDFDGDGKQEARTYQPLWEISIAGDFDGDGCSDVFESGLGGSFTTHAVTYSCAPAVSATPILGYSGYQFLTGDFNGDGMTDYLTASYSATGAMYLSTGTGFTATGFTVPTTWGVTNAVVTADFNGDGRTDVALIGGTISFYLSTGTGFVLAASTTNLTGGTAEAADIGSRGSSDLLVGTTRYSIAYTPELMTSVSNGIGATTTVTYDRINQNGPFYTKGSGATYPTQDMDGPFYAVSRVDTSNGVGGTYGVTYAYAGAKADVNGRGFLGFSQGVRTDLQTSVVTTTNYRTDFPYTGMVSSQTTVHGSITLSSTANTYANTPTTVGGMTRYFVYLTQSVTSGHDLDGSAYPTTTANYSGYDSYGNVGTVAVSVSDGSSKTTTNTYYNNWTTMILGRLLTAQVQSIVGSSNITRHSSFSYNTSTDGLLTQEVV